MGCGVSTGNDIEILQEMLDHETKVQLQQSRGRPSVELHDETGGTTVAVKGLPHDSIVIRPEKLKVPRTVFQGSKGERKRADFVIVSNEEQQKWIICIENKGGNSKTARHVEAQLKGALCLISYCKCIGKSFWGADGFLDGYQYRFVSIADIDSNKQVGKTRPYSRHIQSKGTLHDKPSAYLKFLRSPRLHFRKLLHEVS